MEESVVFERPTQEQIGGDLRRLSRGAIRLALEMLAAVLAAADSLATPGSHHLLHHLSQQRHLPETAAANERKRAGGRGAGRAVTSLAGKGVSASSVSRITDGLDAKVEGLRSMPISEPIGYLYLDATFLDARWERQVENVVGLGALWGR